MKFDENIPIYLQVVDILEQRIASGYYQPEEKLPSRRDVAEHYRVNPNTIQRAFKEMEDRGFIVTEDKQGSYVTKHQEKIQKLKDRLIQQATEDYLNQLQGLGVDIQDLKSYLSQFF